MASETPLRPGEARCPGPSTRNIIEADGQAVPDRLLAESYEFLGDEDIPFDRYTSQTFFDREMSQMWSRVWQWACREEHLPEVGDYVTYDIGPYSVIVVRSGEDEIRAFRNVCPHRATQLRPSDSSGWASEFQCPFHGWTYDLEGKLIDLPCRWDFPHVSKDIGLATVRTERWGGFVFINLDDDAEPLLDYLAPLPEHLDSDVFANRYVAMHVQKELNCNWKIASEAFLEAYHVVATHADFLPTVCDANAQYDLFGDFVSRFVHTQGVPSPHYREPQSQQEILERMLVAPADAVVPEGSTARAVAADALRSALGGQWDVDLSNYTDSEMLDSIEYFLFPNMCLFPGITLPMVYRFRPIGRDPGRTLFDLLFLRPLPPGRKAPLPPEPVRIAEDVSYRTVPGLDDRLGLVYDQDTDNLALQWQGFQNAVRDGQILGNYQEVRIRHMHQTLDQFLEA